MNVYKIRVSNSEIILISNIIIKNFIILNEINIYRRRVHRALVSDEIKHTLCVDDVVAVHTIFKNHNVLNVDILRKKCDHVRF